MIDFRVQGIDILPDIIGYLLFAAGLSLIAAENDWFKKAGKLNIFMIFLSIFQIYEKPTEGTGINFGVLGPAGFIIGMAAMILSLFVIYNLFMGIRDMASIKGKLDIAEEAYKRWIQYLMFQLAAFIAFILILIPLLASLYIIVYVIISFVFAFVIMGFMKRCGTDL